MALRIEGPSRQRLIVLVSAAQTNRDEVAQQRRILDRTTGDHKLVGASRNRRERWFGSWSGWLGGDTGKVARYHELREQKASQVLSLNEQKKILAGIEAEIFAVLDDALRTNPEYQALAVLCEDGEAAEKAAQHMDHLLSAALSEVDDAQDANTLDAFADGPEILDHIETEEAADAIEAVNGYTETYVQAVRRFLGAEGVNLGGVTSLDDFMRTLDIVDIGADFGIGDFFQMQELDDAEDALNERLQSVWEVRRRVAAVLTRLHARREAMHQEALASLD